VHEVDMTKCLILSMEEWAEKKNKKKIFYINFYF